MNADTRQLRRIKKSEWDRPVRCVEKLDFTGIIENSPVEVCGGNLFCDVDDHMLYACFNFRNVSDERIKKLDIRIFCYYNQNIPFVKLPFSYSFRNMTLGVRIADGIRLNNRDYVSNSVIGRNEYFGDLVYIKMPDRYISKIELEIYGVEYAGGEYKKLNYIANTKYIRIKNLSDNKRFLYSLKNIYKGGIEQAFPSVVLPERGEYTWLCCCGRKNLNKNEKCERCTRDMLWQFNNDLDGNNEDIITEYKLYDKSGYSKTNYYYSKKEIAEKEEQAKRAMENVEKMERIKERKKLSAIPMILSIVAAATLFYYLLQFIFYDLLPRLGL